VSGTQAGSRHIERLWAKSEVESLLASHRTVDAVALAGRQQIVTSCSGAVVLETQAQYEANNLSPVDATTVPSIPEPGTFVLLGLGILALAANLRRNRRSGFARNHT
jgi:hypothetical protein